MKKVVCLIIALVMVSFLFSTLSEAYREPPKNVRPMVYKGIKFITIGMGKMGYVEARDIETNKKVWEKKVYNVIHNPLMESDVQDVFISSLSAEDGKLVVVDERGKKYSFDIPKKILKMTENDTCYYSQPWDSKAPYSYADDDYRLVNNSYEEKWTESSVEKCPEAVQRAKEVLREWGQNPEKYEYGGKQYDYKISVSESQNFISIIFNPIGFNITSQEVEIRMAKDSLGVLSILKGS